MQESPHPRLAGEAGRNGDVALTGEEIDGILADFRAWLNRIPSAPPPAPADETVDLATLVRHFTALRQEVNLQTRASRSQLEQNAQSLETLGKAVEHLRDAAAAAPEPDTAEIERPLLKSLVEARDALALAHAQVSKSRETSAPPPQVWLALPTWARWFGLESRVRVAIAPLESWAAARAVADDGKAFVEALVVGYSMSLQRLDRALERHGLERIACVGRPFDPEVMEVVEVVKDPSKGSSEVIEDVRPGYRHRGRLFRSAQVRVARP